MFDDFLENGGIQLVSDALPVTLGKDEVRIPEDAEVSRDRGPCGGELLGDLARGVRATAKQLQYLAARRVSEGSKDGVHLCAAVVEHQIIS